MNYWVVDLHPLFCDKYENLLLHPLIGHTVLSDQSAGHAPHMRNHARLGSARPSALSIPNPIL